MSKKKFILPFTTLALLLGVGLAACSGPSEPVESNGSNAPASQPSSQKVEAIKITAEGGKTSVYLGGTIQLKADKDDVTWASKNEAIATVNSSGLVTAVAEGTVQITASKDGFTTGTISIRVELEPIKVTAADNKTTLVIDETVQLSADKDGVTWASSDATIASVSDKGLVTALKAGSVNITASKDKFKTGSIAIKVTRPAATKVLHWEVADHVSADGEWYNNNRGPGETPIYDKSSASDGTCIGYFGDGDKETLTFTSSEAVKAELVVTMGHNSSFEDLSTIFGAKFNDTEISLVGVAYISDTDGQGGYTFAQVSFGEVDLIKGSNALEISMKGNAPYLDDLEIYAAAATEIEAVPAPEKEKIVISNPEEDLTIEAESTVQLICSTEGVSYKSNNEEIATVSGEGLVTGVAKGNTTIVVSKEGMTTTKVTIKVTEKKVAGEIRIEAESGKVGEDAISENTDIKIRTASTGETLTERWLAGAMLTITFNYGNADSFSLYLNARAAGQYGTSNIDDLAAVIEIKLNDVAIAIPTSTAVSGRTFADYLIGVVTLKAGENKLEIKSIGEDNTAPNIDFIKLLPVA